MRSLRVGLLMRLRVRRCWIVAARGNVVAAVLPSETNGGWIGCRLVPNRWQPCSTVRGHCRLTAIVTTLWVVLSLSRSVSLLFVFTSFAFSLFSLLTCLPLLADFFKLCRKTSQLIIRCRVPLGEGLAKPSVDFFTLSGHCDSA